MGAWEKRNGKKIWSGQQKRSSDLVRSMGDFGCLSAGTGVKRKRQSEMNACEKLNGKTLRSGAADTSFVYGKQHGILCLSWLDRA